MSVFELPAWSRADVVLSHDQAAELAALGLVEVAARRGPDEWTLVSDARIGVANGRGWEVRVRPRVAVRALLFLLAYANDPRGWKDQEAMFASAPELFDAIANGFSWHALNAVERGLLRGYVHVDERLTTIRGRIRFGDQIARGATLPLPVDVSYDDYTEDVVENQMLKTATVALLRLTRLPPLARRRLLKLRGILDGASVLPRPREVEMPQLTRLNERYGPALRLAHLILTAASIDAARGPFAATGFVFDMNRVFEDFVTVALREAMRSQGGAVIAQWPGTLDEQREFAIRPDITWWRGERCLAVADAKYKSLDAKGVPNADAYQLLAYCTVLRLRRGYLVYANDNTGRPRHHRIRNRDCSIEVRTLDVEAAPERLLAQVDALAAEIARSADDPVSA